MRPSIPSITFASTGVSRSSATSYSVTGNLTMHGVTKPVTLAVSASPPIQPCRRHPSRHRSGHYRQPEGLRASLGVPGRRARCRRGRQCANHHQCRTGAAIVTGPGKLAPKYRCATPSSIDCPCRLLSSLAWRCWLDLGATASRRRPPRAVYGSTSVCGRRGRRYDPRRSHGRALP